MITVLNDNLFLTKKELVVLLSKQFNIKFNIYKISLFISKLRYTYKKPRQYSIKNNIFLEKLIAERQTFLNDIKQKHLNKIISIDECGTTTCKINKTIGLSLKGKPIAIPHESEFKNTSLLVAITTTSILHYSIN